MRRSLVISLFTALIAIGGSAASGAATAPRAGASRTAQAIICPLSGLPIGTCCGPPVATPAAATVLPCCPVPIGIGCCPGTVACIAPMTISSQPNPSIAGSAVTITGHVSGAAAGAVVALWQELPSQHSFHKVGQASATASGTYTLRLSGSKVKTDRSWYVASGGVKSFTIAQVVKAKVTVSAHVVKLSHGHRITLTGKIDPSHSGQRVRLEQRVGGAWRVLAHGRLNKRSRYSISHVWAHGRVIKLRISLSADKRNAASLSRVDTITLSG